MQTPDLMPSPPAAELASPVIETFSLTRRYKNILAVDGVTFAVRRAEIFGLIGPNGAGKSTLIKMLTTMLPPSSGRAIVGGFDVAKEPQRVRGHIGYVPQQLSADRELTGYENLLLSARLYLIPRRERATRIREALERLGLSDVAGRLARDYSGGMLRRLEIAQSMMHRPAVLFMDEPTVGLDPAGRHAVWNHVRDLRRELGTAILLSTHYMDEAEDLCDRVGVMQSGRLGPVGTPQELKSPLKAGATLDDVFEQLTGTPVPSSSGHQHG